MDSLDSFLYKIRNKPANKILHIPFIFIRAIYLTITGQFNWILTSYVKHMCVYPNRYIYMNSQKQIHFYTN